MVIVAFLPQKLLPRALGNYTCEHSAVKAWTDHWWWDIWMNGHGENLVFLWLSMFSIFFVSIRTLTIKTDNAIFQTKTSNAIHKPGILLSSFELWSRSLQIGIFNHVLRLSALGDILCKWSISVGSWLRRNRRWPVTFTGYILWHLTITDNRYSQ